MDVFTDVDIFKEIISAALRGVGVYILLDDSRVSSFLNMSRSVGIDILDIKNLRVRTVQGEQYQCRSAVKFHGSLEQRFILVDCQTVLHGTYSYTWSFEKLNLSMVLVVTGQLVSSYNEEFRRLYGRSILPAALSSGSLLSTYPKSSQLSLNHLHMNSRPTPNMRGVMNDRFNDAALLNRGYSVQEMLHQSHFTDAGNLVRGHSYGGDLHKYNSMTRLRMGTKNLGVPVAPGRTGSALRHCRYVHQPNMASQQHLRHQTRYGADHNLIPFNSETSLHKWKIDTYLTERDISPDASGDAQSLMISPHSSHTGLNEYQSQLIHCRSMDIRSRMEEMRQKRLSLQEHANPRQSQESLRSLYSTSDRQQYMRPLQGRPRVAEMDPENISNLKDSELYEKADKTEQIFTDGKRSVSHSNIKMGADQKHNSALTRTRSNSELDSKLSDSTLKVSNLLSDSLRHFRVRESLTEIPEEKEALNSCGDRFESVLGEKKEVRSKEVGPPREGNKSIHRNPAESCPTVELQRGPTKREHTQKEGSELQRKNCMTTITDNEKKVSRKEKSLQRSLLKSQNTLDSNQALQTDHSKASSSGRLTEMSQSQNSHRGPSGTEKQTAKQKYPFSKLSPQRSSKRKTIPSADQDQGLRSPPDNEPALASQIKRERAYSRYEYSISTENICVDKQESLGSSSDKVKTLSLNRQGDAFHVHQTHGGADNKLGRLMQRMGNLINKNK
ncbi:hypothetical protein CRENBAI_024612 [Crenichthys baileyi]|uniref:Scaffolding anchor of CK1 domain-containing protein n=1 Tax=Crenichthys baileyi TaxID=28760 RepID=A0AAV9SNC0_9TELE